MLEREAGVPLLERAGRGVRLTDPALVLVRHAEALLERAGVAEAELAAAAGTVAGRGRIASFQSVAMRLAIPAMRALARAAPGLRCELVEAEPEQSLPALALGDFDLVLADEWQHQPRSRPAGVDRRDLHRDPVYLILPADHPAVARHRDAVPLAELAGEAWTTGHAGDRLGGGRQPDLPRARRLRPRHPPPHQRQRHLPRARRPRPVRRAAPRARRARDPPGVAVRAIAEGSLHRTIFAASRSADAGRPSVRALLAAVGAAAADLGWPGSAE